jgi:hypothetical protein
MFAYWAIVYFGQFFSKITEASQILVYFSAVFILTKMGWAIFSKLIWSPCSEVTVVTGPGKQTKPAFWPLRTQLVCLYRSYDKIRREWFTRAITTFDANFTFFFLCKKLKKVLRIFCDLV